METHIVSRSRGHSPLGTFVVGKAREMNRMIGPDGTWVSAPSFPGKALGITAFVLSFFVQVVALILGLFALAQSRRAGVPNNLALAGVIISAVLLAAGLIVWIAVAAARVFS